MTFKEAYEFGQRQLHMADIEDASVDAWYLLEYVTGISRAMYFMKMMDSMNPEEETKYKEYIEVRKQHIPLQHITGVQEFMGLEFCVNEHVLVPRQDTEVLVETVLKEMKTGSDVLDMCVGSGCIIISLVKLGKDVKGTGVDISEEALKVAAKNCEKLSADVKLIHSDLFEQVEASYDVIVSNPPYIRTAVIEELKEEVKFHDPFLALDGKEDGLYFYRKIVDESRAYLRNGGKLYFEIGHDQGEDVKNLMEEAGFSGVTVKKDFAGLDRVVFGEYTIIG